MLISFKIEFTAPATPELKKAVETFINKLAKLGPLPALSVALEEEKHGDEI